MSSFLLDDTFCELELSPFVAEAEGSLFCSLLTFVSVAFSHVVGGFSSSSDDTSTQLMASGGFVSVGSAVYNIHKSTWSW